MTKQEFNAKVGFTERSEFATLLATWLSKYTDECIKRVLPKVYDIYEDEHAMHLLRELHKREEKERKENADTIRLNLEVETYYEVHNHCLTHANAYREVLYDMYIREA